MPGERNENAVKKYLEDCANPANPLLGLKLNCFAEGLNQYQYENYTGPKADDPDPTASETQYRVLREHFTLPGNDSTLYDFILMNGEVDTLALDSWGKRTLVTSDNNELKKSTTDKGKSITKILYRQFSLLTKKGVINSILVFPKRGIVQETVDRLPDWSIVALEGRLQKNIVKGSGNPVLIADSIIPIQINNDRREDVGTSDSKDPEVRSKTYTNQSSFGSVEDY